MQIPKKPLFCIVLAIFCGCAQAPKTVLKPKKLEIKKHLEEEKKESTTVENSSSTAEYYFGLAEYAYQEKRYKEAYEYYLNASFFDNNSQIIKQKLTLSIYRAIYSDKIFFSRWNKLRSSYFLNLDKNSSLDYLSGILNYLDGNYKIAASYLIKEVVYNENKTKPLFSFLLYTLHIAKMYEQELAIAQMANQSYPDNAKFANWYAYAMVINASQEYYPFAATLLEQCLEQEPDNHNFWDSMMWLYYKWGNQKKAYELAKELLKKEETLKEPEIVLHLGFVYLGQNLLKEAKEYFNLVLELDKGALANTARQQLKLLQTGEKK